MDVTSRSSDDSLGRIVRRKSNHECEIIAKYKQLEQLENVCGVYGEVNRRRLQSSSSSKFLSLLLHKLVTSSLVYLHMVHPHVCKLRFHVRTCPCDTDTCSLETVETTHKGNRCTPRCNRCH